ncbi:MAG: glycosyltransferase family 61 protein [Bacteroidia bacterium]
MLPTFLLREVTVLPNGLVLCGWRLHPASAFWDMPADLKYRRYYALYKLLTLPTYPEPIEKAIVIHHPWANNYVHWLTECLPRLHYAQAQAPDWPVLLPKDYPPFARESLEALGVTRIIEIESAYKYRVHQLLLPHMPAQSSYGAYFEVLHGLRRYFLQAFGRNATSRRLYISRAYATRRRVRNEAEVLPLLRQYGFEVVHTEKLSLKEQVGLFSEAAVLMGLHGAGHANLLWMPEGSHIIEILTAAPLRRTPPLATYANLSHLFRHRHTYFVGQTPPDHEGEIFDRADVYLPPSALEAFLSGLFT